MRHLQNGKCDYPHLPHSPPSEFEGVRIVVISFRNIAKNEEKKGRTKSGECIERELGNERYLFKKTNYCMFANSLHRKLAAITTLPQPSFIM